MRILRAYSRHCYLLESAEDNKQWGRYSFLGYEPVMELTCINGRMTVTRGGESSEKTVETRSVAHPGEVIRDILEAYKSPRLEGMPPFTGGLVGYFSYDYIRYGEPVLDCESDDPSDMDFRDVDLMLFDKVIVFDNYRQKLMLITGVDPAALESSYRQAERGLEEMESLLKSGARAAFKPLRLKEEMEPCFSEPVFCDMVRKAKHYIREGDIFQVVLSNPMEARAEGSLFDTYRVLRTTNPSPYMFYFSSDDIEVAGASPETLVRLDQGKLYTFPLAGTRPRGKTPQEDRKLEEELLKDEKERTDRRRKGCGGRSGRHPAGGNPFRSAEDPGLSDHP